MIGSYSAFVSELLQFSDVLIVPFNFADNKPVFDLMYNEDAIIDSGQINTVLDVLGTLKIKQGWALEPKASLIKGSLTIKGRLKKVDEIIHIKDEPVDDNISSLKNHKSVVHFRNDLLCVHQASFEERMGDKILTVSFYDTKNRFYIGDFVVN